MMKPDLSSLRFRAQEMFVFKKEHFFFFIFSYRLLTLVTENVIFYNANLYCGKLSAITL